jgi:NDP-sugar pyrophosphorylase family protein
MNIVIPIAGEDTFFVPEEYHFPKPLVEVAGLPMIQRTIENIRRTLTGRLIVLARAQDCRQHSLAEVLHFAGGPDTEILTLHNQTQGSAATCLLAITYVNGDSPLVISNGDQVIDVDLSAAVATFRAADLDAGVITFPSIHPRWSYVRCDDSGQIVEAAEKRVISRKAVAGFYYFRRGDDFVRAAMKMIMTGATTKGRYYIAPTLNQLILEGRRVGEYPIESDQYHSFYSPQKVREYENATRG